MQIVNTDIEDYAAENTTPFDPAMDRLHQEASETLPYPQMLSGPVVGRLLETLVFAVGAKLVLEIGTYAGYSAIAMAGGLAPGGRVITCELSEEHAAFARRHIDLSPYADRIELRVGPALDTIAELDGPFDLVFIDADKTGYPDYYRAVLPKLAPGGLIVADNTLHDGGVLAGDADSAGTRAIREFNEMVVNDKRVAGVLLTVRDGVSVIRRR